MAMVLRLFLLAFLVSCVLCGTCDDYWTQYQGHCYRLYRSPVTWGTAKERCEGNSAYLVSINSLGENAFVSYLTACQSLTARGSVTWVGLGPNYHQQNPKRWLDGNTMTYHRWESGEPNNSNNNEGCVITNWNVRGEWNDTPCGANKQYVCEKADQDS